MITTAVYGMVLADLWLRARSAYLEGERCMTWSRDPALKKGYFDARLGEKEKALRRQYDRGLLSPGELDQRVALARFERDQRVAESSVKYAYAWYRSAARSFSPPETRWSARARVRMAEARALWEAELKAKKIPYEPWMLD